MYLGECHDGKTYAMNYFPEISKLEHAAASVNLRQVFGSAACPVQRQLIVHSLLDRLTSAPKPRAAVAPGPAAQPLCQAPRRTPPEPPQEPEAQAAGRWPPTTPRTPKGGSAAAFAMTPAL